MTRLLIIFITLTLFACNNTPNQTTPQTPTANRQFNHETIKSKEFERYLFVKGQHLKSVEQKLNDYGQFSVDTTSFTFSKAQISDWTVIKFPSNWTDYDTYHKIVYWLLGNPPNDYNYADSVIGLSIDTIGQNNYFIFNDYDLREKLTLEDDLFGVFQNNERFILNIPFDKFSSTDNDLGVVGFEDYLASNAIDINKIIEHKLTFVDFKLPLKDKGK